MYTTFCRSLDKLFGGYLEGELLHIFGPGKCGKTTLATYLPIISIYKEKKRRGELRDEHCFIVVNTDRGFSIDRLIQLCEVYEVDFEDIQERLQVYTVYSFKAQSRLLFYDIPEFLDTQGKRPLLISIDPITITYRREWKGVPRERVLLVARELRPELEDQVYTLIKLAGLYKCVATVVNIRRSFRGMTDEERKRTYPFYGGAPFEYLPYATVELYKPDIESEEIEARLWFHRWKRAGSRVRLVITERGFEEVGRGERGKGSEG